MDASVLTVLAGASLSVTSAALAAVGSLLRAARRDHDAHAEQIRAQYSHLTPGRVGPADSAGERGLRSGRRYL